MKKKSTVYSKHFLEPISILTKKFSKSQLTSKIKRNKL